MSCGAAAASLHHEASMARQLTQASRMLDAGCHATKLREVTLSKKTGPRAAPLLRR